jgi:hypothetical protein
MVDGNAERAQGGAQVTLPTSTTAKPTTTAPTTTLPVLHIPIDPPATTTPTPTTQPELPKFPDTVQGRIAAAMAPDQLWALDRASKPKSRFEPAPPPVTPICDAFAELQAAGYEYSIAAEAEPDARTFRASIARLFTSIVALRQFVPAELPESVSSAAADASALYPRLPDAEVPSLMAMMGEFFAAHGPTIEDVFLGHDEACPNIQT